jgi:hypothetical protein
VAFLGLLGFLVPLVFVVLIVAVVAAVVGGRGEADPTGRRPYAIYLTAVTFIAFFTTLLTLFGLVSSLMDTIIVGSSGGPECPPGLIDCGIPIDAGSGSGGREVLQAAFVSAVAGIVLYLHGKKLLELKDDEGTAETAAGRVLLTFGYVVAFVLVFVALGAASAALTSLVDSISPPQHSFGGEVGDRSLATFISAGLLAAASVFLYSYVWRTFGLGIRPRPQGTRSAPPPTPPTVGL